MAQANVLTSIEDAIAAALEPLRAQLGLHHLAVVGEEREDFWKLLEKDGPGIAIYRERCRRVQIGQHPKLNKIEAEYAIIVWRFSFRSGNENRRGFGSNAGIDQIYLAASEALQGAILDNIQGCTRTRSEPVVTGDLEQRSVGEGANFYIHTFTLTVITAPMAETTRAA